MTGQPGRQREGDWRPDPIAAPVSSLGSRIVGDPRLWWRRESDVTRWLADHLDCLAPHLDVRHLEVIGREAVIGERWSTPGRYGIEQTVGGLRMDLAARDEHDRLVIVEVQFGPADHKHVGQLITYAITADAALAVWVVADSDPVFSGDHLAVLARVNAAFAGRPEFRVVGLTLESHGTLVPGANVPWVPTLRGVDPATQRYTDCSTPAPYCCDALRRPAAPSGISSNAGSPTWSSRPSTCAASSTNAIRNWTPCGPPTES